RSPACRANPPAIVPGGGKHGRPQLEVFEWLCWKCSDRPGTARPSDDSLKFRQLARIIEASGNLLARKVRKLRQNVRGSLARRQVTQHQPDGNARPLNPRLASQDFGVADDVLLPFHAHTPILTPFSVIRKR